MSLFFFLRRVPVGQFFRTRKISGGKVCGWTGALLRFEVEGRTGSAAEELF